MKSLSTTTSLPSPQRYQCAGQTSQLGANGANDLESDVKGNGTPFDKHGQSLVCPNGLCVRMGPLKSGDCVFRRHSTDALSLTIDRIGKWVGGGLWPGQARSQFHNRDHLRQSSN